MLLGFVVLHKRSVPMEVIKDRRSSAIVFLVFNVFIGLSIPWIDQAAHIGGFLAGCLCGLALGCDLSAAAAQRKYRNLALAALGSLAAVLMVMLLPPRQPDLGMISIQIDEADAAAVEAYQTTLEALQAGEQTQTSAAREIATVIVPVYVDLAASLRDTTVGNEEQKQVKAALGEYIELRQEGWELMAEAVASDDIVRQGLAIEKFEAARVVVANIRPGEDERNPPPTDLQTEVAVFSVVESRALEKYDRLMQRTSQGHLDDQELADAIAREVLPIWEDGRRRFVAAAESLPTEDQPFVSRFMKYAELQRDGWLLQIQALKRQDDAIAERSRETFNAAAEAAAKIWEEAE
jgi:hypothetical protein